MKAFFIFIAMKIEQLYNLYKNSSGVSTDTRNIQKDNLFFSLSGDNFNGNKFAGEALEKGAVYSIIDDPQYKTSEHCILVKDVLLVLQELAHFHRRKLRAKFIAITGTNGKTTSKELMKAVLSTTFKTYATEGNLNNHIGVPLTLLRISEEIEYAIIEMGANHVGEIRAYCKIADPDMGIITNIGKAHLEGFKSPAGIKKAKGELYEYIKGSRGAAMVNIDHPYLLQMAKGIDHIITYGTASNADYPAKFISANPFVKIEFEGTNIESRLVGKYNSENIILAAAVGRYFNVRVGDIQKGIEQYTPGNNRSQTIEKDSNTFILDAYNANPSSVKAAIQSFSEMQGKQKVAVFGDMLELGKDSFTEHLQIAKLAEAGKFHKLILVGNEFGAVAHKVEAIHFDSVADCKVWFDQQYFTNTLFWIKGSRKIGLEILIS